MKKRVSKITDAILAGKTVSEAVGRCVNEDAVDDNHELDDLVVGNKKPEEDKLKKAKDTVADIFKNKHYLDGIVKGYRVEPVEGNPEAFNVTLQLSSIPLDDYLMEYLVGDAMVKAFGWNGKGGFSNVKKSGDQPWNLPKELI